MTDKTPSPEAQPQKKRRLSPYMMIWVVLTGLSIVYLALLATNPTLVANALGAKSSDHAEQAQVTAMLTTELQRLNETVSRLSSDVQALKVDVTSGADRERELLERVAALESPVAADGQKVAALAPGQAKAAPAQTKPQKVPGQLNAAAAAAPAAPAAAAPVQPVKAPPAKKPAAQQAAAAQAPAQPPAAPGVPGQSLDQFSLETGSVGSEPPVNFGTTVTPAQGQPQAAAQPNSAAPMTVATAAPTAAPGQAKSVGIQIASGPSVQSLRLSWTLLSERHGASLSRYQPRYTVGATEQGVTYDLVVGPFANANEARQVCAELAASATPCSLQAFRGDAL